MRFRILTGSFVQDGRYFVKGDVVSSNRDLSKKFQNKFHKLEENEEAPVSKGKNFKSLDGAAPSGEPEPVVKATPKPKKVDMSAVQADLVLVPLGEGKFDVVNPAT